jgi:ribosome-associated toxin RatA of RatAB toxin-antitoxin module
VKELHGTASASVAAPVEECFALLEALDRYPIWYPEVVREAEVLDRDDDGHPTKARATLHVAHGPLIKDFNLLLAIRIDRPAMVKLTRIPHGPSDSEQFEVTWRLEHALDATRISLELDANLSVPRLVPLGSVGDAMAQGFVSAAFRALQAR